MRGKRGLQWSYVGWILLAIAAIAVGVGIAITIKGGGDGALAWIKNAFSVGRA